MDYTVFYSWQSDLKNNLNRSFILDALQKAAKTLSKDENFSLNTVVDRDTYGINGSPSIVESITGKIALADVFVCDISIINSQQDNRPTPNPNVLYELGFASALLGWDRILMIQNTAFGDIDKLPFDLRGRRILRYHLDHESADKREKKENLNNELTEIFRKSLEYYSKVYRTREKNIWWGNWNIDPKYKMREGQLHISRVSSDAFFYNIEILDGARSGKIYGKAKILTPHSAYSRIEGLKENEDCELFFKRRLENGDWLIEIEEGLYCGCFHGLSTTFSGHYRHSSEWLVNNGYLDEIDMIEIERITGQYLSTFLDNFQQYSLSNDKENAEITVISAGVKGLYTIMESIIAFNNNGDIWLAFIDPEADVIRYFSNKHENESLKPKAIRDWLDRLDNKKVIY